MPFKRYAFLKKMVLEISQSYDMIPQVSGETVKKCERGTAMDERTMYELLEIYDAKNALQKDRELISDIRDVDEEGDRIIRGLSYVISIIARYSPVYRPKKEIRMSMFWNILEDKTIDNHEKARRLLGKAA